MAEQSKLPQLCSKRTPGRSSDIADFHSTTCTICYGVSMTRQEALDLYFMENRAKLIDIAAFLDRIDRCSGDADYRLGAFKAAMQHLEDEGTGRAREVLLALSDPSVEPIAAATTKAAAGAWNGARQS
jgi:hypothetical protein